MATRPIYSAIVYFQYNSMKSLRAKINEGKIECFITTQDLIELNKNSVIINKIKKQIKQIKNINIKIVNTKIIDQHGFTTDRF